MRAICMANPMPKRMEKELKKTPRAPWRTNQSTTPSAGEVVVCPATTPLKPMTLTSRMPSSANPRSTSRAVIRLASVVGSIDRPGREVISVMGLNMEIRPEGRESGFYSGDGDLWSGAR